MKSGAPLPPLTVEMAEQVYQAVISQETVSCCNPEMAEAFVEDVAMCFPGAQGQLLRDNFREFLEGSPLPDDVWKSIRGLADQVRSIGREDLLDRHDERVVGEQMREFIGEVNKESDGGKTVLFVADRPFFMILREAIHLRDRGFRVFLFVVDPIPEMLMPSFDRFFDGVLDARGNAPLFVKILKALTPDIFHVQCLMWNYFLGRLVIENKKKAKVVCEFYDITSIYADRETLIKNWSLETVDFDFHMEKYILHHADGVIVRFPEWVMEEWKERHGALPEVLEFQSYPSPKFIQYSDKKLSDDDGIIRIVYTGGLIPVNVKHSPVLFPEIGMAKGFEMLLRQGLEIDVLNVPHHSLEKSLNEYAAYSNLARQFPNFRLLEGVPPENLSASISHYDFGALLFHFDPVVSEVSETQRKGVIATKIFSYLEAGLPVLVNAEYENMASFVNEHGIGIAVHTNELPIISKIIADFDYPGAVARIKAFNEKNGMDKRIEMLVSFYNRIGVNKSSCDAP